MLSHRPRGNSWPQSHKSPVSPGSHSSPASRLSLHPKRVITLQRPPLTSHQSLLTSHNVVGDDNVPEVDRPFGRNKLASILVPVMRTPWLFFQIFFGLVVTSNSQTAAQGGAETPTSFIDNAMRLREEVLFKLEPGAIQRSFTDTAPGKYFWHTNIVTTTFWIGEGSSGNNPVPNESSAWDLNWSRNYGGLDLPEIGDRQGFLPAKFVPRQNPFYIALPYNDVAGGKTKPEAAQIIPWFKATFVRSGQSVLKGRWLAVRKGSRTCYAQWEDVGPFRTDHWEYVFGNDRPRPNLNRGAGLDISPAVRDYLHLQATDATDWKFVEASEVPPGPWALYGDNNTFVIDRRKREQDVAKRQ